MAKTEKNRKIPTATVLMTVMMICAMGLSLGCDLFMGDESIDTAALKSAISEAKSLLNNTIESEDGSGVSVGAYWATNANKNNLNTAITAAEGVLSTANTQDDIYSATSVLNTAINVFKGQRKLKEAAGNDPGNKIGEITGTITLTNIPATGRPKVTIRAGIDGAGVSYHSDLSEISLSGVPSNQTEATVNWSIPVYENEWIPEYAIFSLYVTPAGTTSSLYIEISPDGDWGIEIPENHVVGFLGTYSIGTLVLSGTIDVKHNGTPVPWVEMSASSAMEREPLGGFTILSSPGTNSPWAMVLPSYYASIGMVLEITGFDDSWDILFETTFRSDLLSNVSSNVSGININLGDITESGGGKTITITNIPDTHIDNDINVYLFQSNTNLVINGYFSSAYGYDEVDNLSKTLELFYPSSVDPWTETGSYYVVVSFAYYYSTSDYYISKNKVNFDANPAAMNFNTDFVKYNDFTPPADTVPLAEDIWESGYLSYSGLIKWYSFNVQKDTDYEIFINDVDFDELKADVVIDIFLNGVKIGDCLDIGYNGTGEFTAYASGTVHVRVYPSGPGSFSDIFDSFDIGYNKSGNRAHLE